MPELVGLLKPTMNHGRSHDEVCLLTALALQPKDIQCALNGLLTSRCRFWALAEYKNVVRITKEAGMRGAGFESAIQLSEIDVGQNTGAGATKWHANGCADQLLT
ncbi:MAG TPA: hypothetical protein VN788_08095, partial [Verrucomicrobiae bacterium]|nr:hypothetical protein [Verrucomicrobiae bacterium]